MPSFDYPRIAETAERLLVKFGTSAVLSREGGDGAYNPATGKVEGGGTQTWDCTAAVLACRAQDIDGTLIQAGDSRVLIAPDIATVPETGDVVTVAGRTLTVTRVAVTAPAGIAVLYDVQARG